MNGYAKPARPAPSLWRRFLAFTRLDLKAVCELSEGRGLHNDYHDYADGTVKEPMHFYEYTCRRCGKRFMI